MSYTLAYTGAEIDALLGKIDAIFVAEYGSTIYSEVTAAIAADNKVIVANAGKVYVYAGQDDNSGYVFTQSGPNAAKPNATYVTLSTGNVWSTATVDLATVQQFYASLMEDTASGSIASFPDGASGVPVAELSCEIVPVQSGSGDPSPDNIRPISGYTGAEIPVTGINVWDEEWELGSIDGTTGEPVDNANIIRSKNFNSCLSNISYYVQRPNNSTNIHVYYYRADYTYIGKVANVGGTVVTTPDNTAFFKIIVLNQATYNHDISINYPSTDTSYHAYNGTVYPVSWTDHGTIYKGTAEYKGGGEWEITSTHGEVDMGSLSWTYAAPDTSRPYGNFYAGLSGKKYGEVNLISSMFKTLAGFTTDFIIHGHANSANVYVVDSAYTDAATFKTAVTGQTLVYELVTPVTFTVTGPDPETLLGDNNIWSDTGDISVKYRANTALYIEKRLGE